MMDYSSSRWSDFDSISTYSNEVSFSAEFFYFFFGWTRFFFVSCKVSMTNSNKSKEFSALFLNCVTKSSGLQLKTVLSVLESHRGQLKSCVMRKIMVEIEDKQNKERFQLKAMKTNNKKTSFWWESKKIINTVACHIVTDIWRERESLRRLFIVEMLGQCCLWWLKKMGF